MNEAPRKRAPRAIDLTGQHFGRLTVIGRDEEDYFLGSGRVHWLCRCDCGELTTVLGQNLRTGQTRSCGCLRKENGKHWRKKEAEA